MEDLAFASIKTLASKLAKKEITVDEIIDLSLKRFERYDGEVGSALEIFDRDTLKVGTPHGQSLLRGIPGLVKDVICQNGRITACGSKMLARFRSPYDATAVKKLKECGAIAIGRANCDEFAMGSSGETSAFKKTANPWDLTRVPGGSSSGSAAAVAAGFVPWALGTETGGSVRQPASLCGIVGMKPTYGLVSRYGLVAYASSLDQIGPCTRTIYDNALVLSAIAGNDPCDSTTRQEKVPDYTQGLSEKLKQGLTIGVIKNAFNAEGIHSEVRVLLHNALDEYKRLGARLVSIQLPLMDYGAAVYFIVSRAEAASNLARFDGVRYGFRAKSNDLDTMYARTRSEGFGRIVKQRILIGNYVLSAGHAEDFYKSAKKVQALLRAQFIEAFKKVDVLFAPVSPGPAFTFGQVSGLEMDLQDYFTAPANLAGIPALAIPCGFTASGLPVGFQLYGPDLSEHLLYQVGYAYEQNTPWHTHHPKQYS